MKKVFSNLKKNDFYDFGSDRYYNFECAIYDDRTFYVDHLGITQYAVREDVREGETEVMYLNDVIYDWLYGCITKDEMLHVLKDKINEFLFN